MSGLNMLGSSGAHRDRLDICFVDTLIQESTRIIESNVEKAIAKNNRGKWQNFQHLISKVMQGSKAAGVGQGAKTVARGVGILAGVATAASIFPPGMVIAGGALATLLGLAKGTKCVWNINEKVVIGNQVNLIRNALHEHSEEKDIADLMISARKIITEVAYTLKLIFCQQLQHLELERDLRTTACYAVSIIFEKDIWKSGDMFDRNTVLEKIIQYRPDMIGRLSSMWDNRVRTDFGHNIKMSYIFYQPGIIELESGNYFQQNVKHSRESPESYGFRQPVLKQVVKNGLVAHIPHQDLDNPSCPDRPRLQPIRQPSYLTKYEDLDCQIFKSSNIKLDKCIYWYSGFHNQGNIQDLSKMLTGSQLSLKMVMLHQNIISLPKDSLSEGKFIKSTFISCDFSTVHISNTVFMYCRFINCRFNETIFENCYFFKSDFIFCQLPKTEFRYGLLDIKDDMGTDMSDVHLPGMTAFQAQATIQQKSSLTNDMSESRTSSIVSNLSIDAMTPRKQSQIAIPDADLILESDDDINRMISSVMKRLRYMDPLTIIHKLKQEKEYQLSDIELMEQSVQKVLSAEDSNSAGPWNSKGNKVLEFIAIGGLVQYLQQNHVNINAVTREKSSLYSELNFLFYAIEEGHEEIGYTLLQAGVNPAFKNILGYTALHLAACKGFTSLGRMIIEYKACDKEMKKRINDQDVNGNTALHTAIAENQEEFVKMALSYDFIDLDSPNKDLNTPLHIACQKGFTGFIESLIQSGANPTKENKFKETPGDLCKAEIDFDKKYLSHFSSKKQDWGENEKEAARLLKQNKLKELKTVLETQEVNINAFSCGKEVENLLMIAIGMGNLSGVKLLLEKGCNADEVSDGSTTSPLLLASSIPVSFGGDEMEEIAICILEAANSKDTNERATKADRKGKTPLHGACTTGKLRLVKRLIEIPGVDVNAEMEDNWTPLHAAALAGHKQIYDLLIAKGADKGKPAQSYRGIITPLQLYQYYNGATLEGPEECNMQDDIPDEALPLGQIMSHDYYHDKEYNRSDTQEPTSLQDFDPEFVKVLATKCYRDDKEKPEDIAEKLFEDNMIPSRLKLRVQGLAEGLQDGTMTPNMFVQRLGILRQQLGNEEVQSNDGSQGQEQKGEAIRQVNKPSPGYDNSSNSKVWGQFEDEAKRYIRNKQKDRLESILNNVNINAEKTFSETDGPKTLLCLAVEYDFEEGVDILLKNGADPTWKRQFDKSSLLHRVAELHGNCIIARNLIEYGAYESEMCHRVNSQDQDGFTPLCLAIQHKRLMDFVNLLLQYKCVDVNKAATDPKGWTPLHQAAAFGRRDQVEALLKAGAEKSPQATFEKDEGYGVCQVTPAEVARKKNFFKIVKLLA